MIAVETEKNVEVDWCPECGGVWFDAGEIELLLGCEKPIPSLFREAPETHGEESLPCPRCRGKLVKVGLGSTVLDHCPENHGVWFDAGELEALAAAAETEEVKEILNHLTETFGKKGD